MSRIDDAVKRILRQKFRLGLFENPFPDSTLVSIENAGHWVHAEAPDDFVDCVLGFCLR